MSEMAVEVESTSRKVLPIVVYRKNDPRSLTSPMTLIVQFIDSSSIRRTKNMRET